MPTKISARRGVREAVRALCFTCGTPRYRVNKETYVSLDEYLKEFKRRISGQGKDAPMRKGARTKKINRQNRRKNEPQEKMSSGRSVFPGYAM